MQTDIDTLHDLLTRHHGDGPLPLDLDQPADRAILALLVALKIAEQPDGSWNGADTVATLTTWFERLGLASEDTLARLAARIQQAELDTAGGRASGARSETRSDLARLATMHAASAARIVPRQV